MISANIISTFFSLNILLILGFLFIQGSFYLAQKLKIDISFREKLQLNYWVVFVTIALTCLLPLIPNKKVFIPTIKVWSAENEKMSHTHYDELNKENDSTLISLGSSSISIRTKNIFSLLNFLGLFLSIFGCAILLKEYIILNRIKNNSYLFKKIGKVTIYLNDFIQVPFSYFSIGAKVIIPSSMILNDKKFKIALTHELQHHRQKDTLWVYVFLVLRSICIVNPFMHLWTREIFELQEFSCDEALIGRKKVNPQVYARCLLEVAENAVNQQRRLHCATGLTLRGERKLLKRRIEKMFVKSINTKNSVKFILGIILGVALSISGYTSSGIVQDRRVTLKEASEMAKKAKENSSFPIVINELVIRELNQYLGTPDGRDFIRKSLERMEVYRPMLDRKIKEYHMPEELMAVPIIESGYQNLPQSENKSWGAGLWMFIEPTARNYGLRIDSVIDERLNPEILTDAAMRYILANYSRFKDYQLAMLGYNIGENKVQEGINKFGSRDAWFLTKNGYQGDQYLARLMAAILIMKNPDSIKE